jgi:indole-3-glycerol phosphate synthase
MPTILDKIVLAKQFEIQEHIQHRDQSELEKHIATLPPTLNFAGALWGDEIRLITEIKKASPSKGILVDDFSPTALATAYAENGAAAISVLTDRHFQGSLAHLTAVKSTTKTIPILRKDFITTPYQVYESRAFGADATLLIVAILSDAELHLLVREANGLRLQCLVEVHNQHELERALAASAEIIGINNRDLHTFKTDLSVTQELVALIPRDKIVISESGIQTRKDMLSLHSFGVQAALVGEALVTAKNAGTQVRMLLGKE